MSVEEIKDIKELNEQPLYYMYGNEEYSHLVKDKFISLGLEINNISEYSYASSDVIYYLWNNRINFIQENYNTAQIIKNFGTLLTIEVPAKECSNRLKDFVNSILNNTKTELECYLKNAKENPITYKFNTNFIQGRIACLDELIDHWDTMNNLNNMYFMIDHILEEHRYILHNKAEENALSVYQLGYYFQSNLLRARLEKILTK